MNRRLLFGVPRVVRTRSRSAARVISGLTAGSTTSCTSQRPQQRTPRFRDEKHALDVTLFSAGRYPAVLCTSARFGTAPRLSLDPLSRCDGGRIPSVLGKHQIPSVRRPTLTPISSHPGPPVVHSPPFPYSRSENSSDPQPDLRLPDPQFALSIISSLGVRCPSPRTPSLFSRWPTMLSEALLPAGPPIVRRPPAS